MLQSFRALVWSPLIVNCYYREPLYDIITSEKSDMVVVMTSEIILLQYAIQLLTWNSYICKFSILVE